MSVKKVNSGLLEFSDEVKVFVAIDEDGKVEKAVTIDEDGKETDIGGSSITVESLTATENNTYNAGTGKAYNPVVVNVPQPTGKINITENGTDIDVAQYALADVAVPASVSDFSTAEVTITNNTNSVLLYGAFAIDLPDPINISFSSAEPNPSGEVTPVILYKGAADLLVMNGGGSNIVVTGDIEVTGSNIRVTGNGTITISDTQ